ncbi:hypothetical protein [Phaeovulum sp.]|jgi:hypothetical protein|uniref:hypothetical protein n=1 Tax=Phaeovulum sp. TaxID=2934796 RepID=UPI00272F8C47|nr:hypothetical protein [Phaeovulum sp.]MDP1669774.1 hypothetical protein [Phaeovulum sp.]MDP2063279.1 hypothetical protein [Phaeovulum sp.]MDP3861071.1 hypothetical protein [Phaeovulum sp.]MDZ4119062.1 hypothetical protein [Phaeovulum sp.]
MAQDQARAGAVSAQILQDLIEELGAWRVLGAVLRALTGVRRQPRDARALSPHIRRDIGLPPSAAPPVGRGQFW